MNVELTSPLTKYYIRIFRSDAQALRTQLEKGKKVLRDQTENLQSLESDYESLEKNYYKEKDNLEETLLNKDIELSELKVRELR